MCLDGFQLQVLITAPIASGSKPSFDLWLHIKWREWQRRIVTRGSISIVSQGPKTTFGKEELRWDAPFYEFHPLTGSHWHLCRSELVAIG